MLMRQSKKCELFHTEYFDQLKMSSARLPRLVLETKKARTADQFHHR